MENELRLKGVGALLGQAWNTLWINLSSILQIAFLGGVVGAIIAFLEVSESPILRLLSFLLQVIAMIWLTVGMLYIIGSPEKLTAKEALKKAWGRILLSYYWIVILSGLITIGGFILLIVPGIIIAVWFSLAFYVFIAEDLRGVDALMRSKQLVQGHWWGVFGRLLVALIISIVASLPLFLLMGGATLALLSTGTDFTVASVIVNAIATPFGFFVSAFGVAFGFALYKSLKEAKGNSVYEKDKESIKKFFILAGITLLVGPLLGILLVIGGALSQRGTNDINGSEIQKLDEEQIRRLQELIEQQQ